ncbi:conserved membrane hypothetical protein [Burkholderia diffusa]|uniref:hypothetical protein n=1 Tax=Burkholderia diffusa TaxID=488732 RepID=UPI001CB149E0|nr:hypothetical protein [Burkholderia diffusa]CAG9256070.1 conserved membrane hypothetical protein [Burkholderia diffusa]
MSDIVEHNADNSNLTQTSRWLRNMKIPSKEQTEQLKNLLSIAQASVVVIGVLVVFLYCASENITPDGLSLGDAFFLIWIALGFGFMLVVGTQLGLMVALIPAKWFLAFIDRLNGGRTSHQLTPYFQEPFLRLGSGFGLFAIALGVVLAVVTKTTFDWVAIRTGGFFVLYGGALLVSCFARNTKRQPIRAYSGLTMLALASSMFIVCLGSIKPELLNYTMQLMGIRSEPRALLVVSSTDHDRLDELAKQSGISMDFCKLPRSNSWGTLDARAVWHGIGTTSYVKLLDSITDGRRNLLVPIPRANLEVVRPKLVSLTCKDALGLKPQ